MKKKEMTEITKRRSLTNIVYDLIELDYEASENAPYIESIMTQLVKKVDDYYFAKKFCESDLERIKEEKRHMNTMQKRLERVLERLKDRSLYVMDLLGESKLKGDKHTLSRREYASVIVEDPEAVPEEYKSTEVIEKIDTKRLLSALKSGQDIPGARLEYQKTVMFK